MTQLETKLRELGELAWVERYAGGAGSHSSEIILNLLALIEKQRGALAGLVKSTEAWNTAVEAIVGRQPQTGIDLFNAKEALAFDPFECPKKDNCDE